MLASVMPTWQTGRYVVEIRLDLLDQSRAAVPCFDQGLDLGGPHLDGGELGKDEERIEEDEEEGKNDVPDQWHGDLEGIVADSRPAVTVFLFECFTGNLTVKQVPVSLTCMTDFEEGFLIGILVGEGHFGGDGLQPQVTLRMHVRHQDLFHWLAANIPGSKLYGPYHHGGRHYFQWMVRGQSLREELLPILRRRPRSWTPMSAEEWNR